MENLVSKNLIYLNEKRIEAEQRQNKKIKNIINNLKLLVKYISLGNIEYTIFRLMRKRNNKGYISTYKRKIIREKIAVYTVVFGKYDNIHNPLFKSSNCDYYIITNNDIPDGSVWKKYILNNEQLKITEGMTNLEKARYFKLHPHELFKDYKYSVFVDGNVQIISDIYWFVEKLGKNFIASHRQKERDCVYQEATEILAWKKANKKDVYAQIAYYKKEGFPKHFGMFQTNVLVREHNNIQCIVLMNYWWKEISRWTKRDQLSFTYSIWKLGLTSDDISVLAESSYSNPRIYIHEHGD